MRVFIFIFLAACKTWNKFAFDFYWHIRIFIDRFNLHFDFNFAAFVAFFAAVVAAVVLANKPKAFCIYLRQLVVVLYGWGSGLQLFFFFAILFCKYLCICVCILFLRRHKLVAAVGTATSRWVQQKHTFAIFIKFYCINYLIYDFLFALRLFAFLHSVSVYGPITPPCFHPTSLLH